LQLFELSEVEKIQLQKMDLSAFVSRARRRKRISACINISRNKRIFDRQQNEYITHTTQEL